MAPPQSFANDPTKVMHVIIMSVFSFLAIVAVLFRWWARRIQRSRWEWSDYFVIVGLAWALALSLFTIHSNVYWDLGGNVTQIGNPEAIQALVIAQVKALLVGQVTWAVSVFFIRASILALYIRIFRTRSFRVACYVIHSINLAFFVTIVMAACLICRPISFNWDRTIPGGTCGDQKSLDLYIGIFNLLLDVAVVIMPMPVLWGLQMAMSKKFILSGMFGLGIIICVITLIRIKITSENHGTNAQEIYSIIALFTCLEALLGVINACLPVLKPIFNKMSDSRASSWLTSVMSGSIPIFMRPSQMGSTHKSQNSGWASKRQSRRQSAGKHPMPTTKEENEMPKWPGCVPVSQITMSSPPPRYVDNKAAGMMFSPAPTYTAIRSPPPTRGSDTVSVRPPVPPKGSYYSPTKRWEPASEKDGAAPGIFVQREWDVERGESIEGASQVSEDTERGLLRDKRKDKQEYGRW